MRHHPLLCAALCGLTFLSPAAFRPFRAMADEVSLLRLEDSTGQSRTVICRPVEPGETAPAPISPASSPALAPAARQAGQRSAPSAALPREAQEGSFSRICPPPPTPSALPGWQLYADPAAVAAAWECYAPRKMAYAPRPWHGPDPAVHGPLPPLRPVSRPVVRKAAPAVPPSSPDASAPRAENAPAVGPTAPDPVAVKPGDAAPPPAGSGESEQTPARPERPRSLSGATPSLRGPGSPAPTRGLTTPAPETRR